MNNGKKLIIIGFIVIILDHFISFLIVLPTYSKGVKLEAFEPFRTIAGWIFWIGIIMIIVGIVVFVKTRKNKPNKLG